MESSLISIALLLAAQCYPGDPISWREKGGYIATPQHSYALEAAKKYTISAFKNNQGNILHFEYSISNIEGGYRVSIQWYNSCHDGEEAAPAGSHFSLDIDNEGKVYKIYPGV